MSIETFELIEGIKSMYATYMFDKEIVHCSFSAMKN